MPPVGSGRDDRPVCLLVLGMHRSGTSALARVLSLMGAALPQRLMGSYDGNPTGHWEPLRLVKYHDQLLEEFGSSWNDWRPLDMTTLPVERRLMMKSDIVSIIRQDYGAAPLITIKDPRVSRFPEFFIECLDKAGYRVVPVLAQRNPLEVIDSIMARDALLPKHMTRGDAALLWLESQLAAERATRALPRTIVSYERLLSDWQGVVETIARNGKFTFPTPIEAAAPEVAEFLQLDRRHMRRAPSDVRLDPQLHGLVADTFETMRALENAAASGPLSQRLDSLHREFLGVVPALAAAAQARIAAAETAEAAGKRADALEQSKVELAQRQEQSQAQIAALNADLHTKETEIQHLHAEIEAGRSRLAELTDARRLAEARLTQSAAELEELRNSLDAALLQREAVDTEAATLRQSIATLIQQQELSEKQAQEHLARISGDLATQKALTEQVEIQRAAAIAQAEAMSHQLNLLHGAARQVVTLLNDARGEQLRIHAAYRSSTSWRVSAPLRWMGALLRGKSAGAPAVPGPITYEHYFGETPAPAPAAASHAIAAPRPAAPAGTAEIVYFTICSRNFMAFARTLYQSLVRFYPNIRFIVALCDDHSDSAPFVAANEPFEFLRLDDLAIPDWREMSQRYNVTEFNTAIKPFVFQYIFEHSSAPYVVYLDPDIYVVDHLTEIENAFKSGADVILTPHMLEPNERAEMNERRLLQYGIYNLGFVGVARTPKAIEIMRWWGRRLEHECIIKRDEGLFVDQKWADHFPAFFEHPAILHHPGYNVAYWNLSNRTIRWTGEQWQANGQPLRFVHFSGNNLDDPKVLSRHSGEHRPDTIGDLRLLLEEYRRTVFGNGHRDFRKIPYAFSWGGAAGVNEHTPKPAHEATNTVAETSVVSQPQAGSAKPASTGELLRTAIDLAGGPGKLIGKTARALTRGDLATIRHRIGYVRGRVDDRAEAVAIAAREGKADLPAVEVLPFRKKVLVIEWTTPKPDSDSGSRTVFYTIEILTLLGYDVTFLPIDLKNAGRYSRDLERIGVRCIDASDCTSVRSFFQKEGPEFDFVVLNRISVVGPHMADIRSGCRNAKMIFNTVDLHYLREMRDAELNGKPIDDALRLKQQELDVVRMSHATIVLSAAEADILRNEVPEAKVAMLPLVFSEIDATPPGFDQRADILFIGSFPHKPNVDAVLYFADQIFPALRARNPALRFHVVGSEPTPEVLALSERPGIIVHGFVADITPLFRSVRLTVAPLRFGAGIKGKVATSLSFGVPCVCSPVAAEGMNVTDGRYVAVADTVEEWCDAILSLYNDRKTWTEASSAAQDVAVKEFSVAANTKRLAALMADVDEDASDLAFLRFGSQAEYDRFWALRQAEIEARGAIERALLPSQEEPFDVDGFCAVCGAPSTFRSGYMYASADEATGKRLPNWREHLACTSCGFTNRLRAAMHAFLSRAYPGPTGSIYITEQTTPLFRWLNSVHPGLQGSEYLGDACAFGTVKNGLRNEDMTRLTFADQSFDAILSFDVLEHVADDHAAFRECFRCLKPGGVLFFTAPFSYNSAAKLVRARVTGNGTIEHLLPPEYHGNPVDPDGALCFRYFGWDVLNDLREAGFADAEVLHYWSRDFGYLGPFGHLIVARRAG